MRKKKKVKLSSKKQDKKNEIQYVSMLSICVKHRHKCKITLLVMSLGGGCHPAKQDWQVGRWYAPHRRRETQKLSVYQHLEVLISRCEIQKQLARWGHHKTITKHHQRSSNMQWRKEKERTVKKHLDRDLQADIKRTELTWSLDWLDVGLRCHFYHNRGLTENI